jgi:hypothetical protein
LRVDLDLSADGSAGAGRFAGDRSEVERIEAAGVGAGWVRLAVLPLNPLQG